MEDKLKSDRVDPLLECLLKLSKINHKTISKRALLAGLPLGNHQSLTPELFVRAAKRIDVQATIKKQKLFKLSKNNLPIVVLMKNGGAGIISDFYEDDSIGIEIFSGDSTAKKQNGMSLESLEEQYSGYCIQIEFKYQLNDKTISPKETHKKHWFWSVVLKPWKIYSEVLLAAFIINLFTIASPLFVMNVYDRVVPNNAVYTLWMLAIGILIVYTFDFILRTLRSIFIDAAAKNIDTNLSATIFEQILGLEMTSRPSSVGGLANTVHAFENFREFMASTTIALLIDLPFIILFLIVIAMIGGSIVFVPIFFIPIVFIFNFLLRIPVTKLVHELYKHTSEKQALLVESITGAETIKGSHAEGVMQYKWESIIKAAAKLSEKLKKFSNLGINFAGFTMHLATVFVVVSGVYKISNGSITLGALVACVILSGCALAPIGKLAGLLSHYQLSKASLDAIDQFMKLPTEMPENKHFLHRNTIVGNIKLENVTFNFPEKSNPIVENISLNINAGEKVAIIGKTGSGKTTIQKLLLKLYKPTKGTLLVDSIDIDQINPAELRSHVGYMPQDVALFYGSIRDNISLKAPHASDEEIIRVAKLAGVDQFINYLPNGFDYQILDRGLNLSGGQRQAIALARSLLLDPAILVIDEPCSGMDDLMLTNFMLNMQKNIQNKTLILATHRKPLLALVDRIIVLDKGKIVLDGPRDLVLNKLSRGGKDAKSTNANKIQDKSAKTT